MMMSRLSKGGISTAPVRAANSAASRSGVSTVAPSQHHVRAVAAGGQELGHRDAERHEDRRVDAESLRRERDPLGVVAGRRRDDPAGTLLLGQAREPVRRAADLERAGALQVLELEVHRHAEHLGEGLRLLERRVRDHARQYGRRPLELFQGGDGRGETHGRVLLVRGTVSQIRSPCGAMPVSQARELR